MRFATKSLMLLVGLVLLTGLCACQQVQQALQTPPELTAYREGLHAVDEPLYRSHLLLMSDAVKAGIRTAADQSIVQQGITSAESLYNQSRATEATSLGAPATPVAPTLPVIPATQP